jgi:hypothetical protein
MTDSRDDAETHDFMIDPSGGRYHQLNAGINRRQATNLRAPALTWHRAFWLQPQYTRVGIPDEMVLDSDRRNKTKTIDEIILAVWAFIYRKSRSGDAEFSEPECHPKVSRPPKDGVDTGQDVYLLFGCAVTPKPSKDMLTFKDTLTFKEIANLHDRKTEAEEIKKLQGRESEIFTSDNRVVSLKFSLHGVPITLRIELHPEYFTLSLYAEIGNAPLAELRNKRDELAGYFANLGADGKPQNEYFFHIFWRTFFLAKFAGDVDLKKKLNDPILHDIFVDFRGLIICNENYKVQPTQLDPSEPPDWANEIEKQCLKLFTHHDKYECTASYLLDGRAVYFTTLAPQFADAPAKELIPLEYVLYVHQSYNICGKEGGVNKWQLGRLADRIHLLGTVRLASLKYLRELRKVGETLSSLDSYINAAREAIDPATEPEHSSGFKEKERQESRRKKALSNIEAAHATFGRITRDFNEGTETNTGILYRIEQSRYYKEQFDKSLAALRIGRFEGYQRYDQFIERRIGAAFDFIDRLGRRYERATNTISTLDENYLAMESNLIETSIRKIQEWGEFALLSALVPYYVSHLLSLILQENYLPITTVAIWAGFGAFAVYRKTKLKLPSIVIVALVVMLIIDGWYHPYHYSGVFRFPAATIEESKAQNELIEMQKKTLKSVDELLKLEKGAQQKMENGAGGLGIEE